ncbi:ETC complex I subunit [Temperatibacter marinus]|uniref:ETC complex I subunit n=1 Tax=Temperatibacter marinus TaxID=1456591 RepID=A0AA52H8A5_9PROT|nr:ETC complex I subunit [Temperatibacter marinus]WND01926.1 ETC complex I subunit [Temperatibacter marinus]
MKARIYCPSKSVTQSGSRGSDKWVLEYEPAGQKAVETLMGWTGTKDALQQVKLSFPSQDEAEAYAKRKGIDYDVKPQQSRRVRFQAYADNFK